MKNYIKGKIYYHDGQHEDTVFMAGAIPQVGDHMAVQYTYARVLRREWVKLEKELNDSKNIEWEVNIFLSENC